MFPELTLPQDLRRFVITDMHTCGEPVRILELPAGMLTGDTLTRRQAMKAHHDDIRQAMMLEPRGHDEMYGAILSPADADDPDPSPHVLFCHTTGYSTMCGHATLALGRYLKARNFAPDSDNLYRLRVPCGTVEVAYDPTSGQSVFDSVACHAQALDLTVNVPELGPVTGDIGYGGAFYFILPGSRIGLDINTQPVSHSAAIARQIFKAAKDQLSISSHLDADLEFLYGVILTDDASATQPSRNICLFGANQIDRSPTGSGVGARLALAHARNDMPIGQWREFQGASAMGFEGQIHQALPAQHTRNSIQTRIRGQAYFTGQTQMILEPQDPARHGFQLD